MVPQIKSVHQGAAFGAGACAIAGQRRMDCTAGVRRGGGQQAVLISASKTTVSVL
jgi:hypothetical protein